MMRKVFFGAALAAAMGGLQAQADTLVLTDGTRMTGELISVVRGTVTFRDTGNDYSSRARQVRVPLSRVERIDFTDERYGVYDDDNGGVYTDRDASGLGQGRERVVTVPADRQWTDTGITVRAGQTLQFEPQGTVSWGPGRNDGPEGEYNSPVNANRPLSNAPGAALIGRIGHDVFVVGSGGSFRARTSGRLYLGINDDYLQDNSGRFTVRVYH